MGKKQKKRIFGTPLALFKAGLILVCIDPVQACDVVPGIHYASANVSGMSQLPAWEIKIKYIYIKKKTGETLPSQRLSDVRATLGLQYARICLFLPLSLPVASCLFFKDQSVAVRICNHLIHPSCAL